ncbi:Platelet-activating factor acetylhydrolase IB subunit beta like [Dissostichus eleginoides]|uniref:Platelet-activating factor acetylhydrolase IB subunit beta like n=1 Tax=Dissostichus eleginoides TaxID=100907 RepID=A0AAD9CJL0_DISEL|nr:Platelet-activating factor acetylhydrolase IB subunit beta like [Dissostichus eleginoides]
MDLLSEQQLGSPSHIIIHTGSNDLRSQQERVSESLRGVIEKASTTFPNSRVVMSTLLPRKDLHPDTIHRINSNMSRDCILRPNVHLPHHPTLDINCLYDHVHLYKNTVPIFARTLKDVALNRDQSTPPEGAARPKTPLDQKGTPLDHHPDNTHGDKIILIFFHTMPH